MTDNDNAQFTQITCPNCGELASIDDGRCPNCEIDLAIAAVWAESMISPDLLEKVEQPLSPEILVPRLGEYLVENGKLTHAQLQQALDYQKQQAGTGRSILLGETLIELDLVARESLDQAVTEQILGLQRALQKYNQQLEQLVRDRTVELQKALNKLTELNRLKNNFISNISHELRTPLAHMIGYIDLIGDESLGPLTAEQITAVEVLVKASNRLQSLIDNLLQFSLASQGYMQLDLSPVSLQMIIKSAISKNIGKAKEARISLKVDAPTDTVYMQADAEKIIWVLEQLLDNGIKFNKPDGEVVLRAVVENSHVLFTVVDTGIGIPEHRMSEIFEVFHQLDSSTTRRYGGTGLGLSLSKRILDAHESELLVLSKEGEGSRFEFTLPIIAFEE